MFQNLVDCAHAYIKTGSQKRAGQMLGLSQEKIGQRLRMLEKRVGYEVFERHARFDILQPRLTARGVELLKRNQESNPAAL